MMPLAARLAIVSALAPTAFATDHLVGPPGSGAPYSSIQAAVDAASPGDRVLVQAGSYEQTVLVNKAIELIGGLGGPSVIKGTNPAPAPAPTQLVVRDLPAGTRARVSNFVIQPLPHALYLPPVSAVGVYACAGRVELSQLSPSVATTFGYALGSSIALLDIRDCAQVYAAHVNTPVQASFATNLLAQGHHGAYVEDSTVVFHDCHLQGELRTWGGAGLRAANSSIEVSRCVLSGGQAYGAASTPGAGGPGVELVSSHLRVAGGSGSALRGADAIDQLIPFTHALGLAASAVSADAASSIVFGAEVLPEGGAAAQGFPAAPAVSAAGAVTTLGHRLPVLTFEPPLGAPGAPLMVRVEGEPGTKVLRFLSLATGPAFTLPGFGGGVLLDLSTLAILPGTLLDATGNGVVHGTVPLDPAFLGTQFLEQGVQVLPGSIDISVPAQISVSS